MKLLLDENLSPRLSERLQSVYPGTTHVEFMGQRGCTDTYLWEHAKENGYVIVSKDNDFRQRSFLYGGPPKVIWLNVGNCPTDKIFSLLVNSEQTIITFLEDQDAALLELI